MHHPYDLAPPPEGGYLVGPVRRVITRQQELIALTRLTCEALGEFVSLPRIVKLLKQSPEDIELTEKAANLAAREVARQFALTLGQATVALWGSLEAVIRDLLVRWLVLNPSALQAPSFEKVRVRVAEYERLDPEARMRLVLAQLEQDLGARLKAGVGRFECLLEALGFAGGVADSLRRDLVELQATRNVLVHRAGLVDHRFLDSCPWLGMALDDEIAVDRATHGRFCSAFFEYIARVIERTPTGSDTAPPEAAPIPTPLASTIPDAG